MRRTISALVEKAKREIAVLVALVIVGIISGALSLFMLFITGAGAVFYWTQTGDIWALVLGGVLMLHSVQEMFFPPEHLEPPMSDVE